MTYPAPPAARHTRLIHTHAEDPRVGSTGSTSTVGIGSAVGARDGETEGDTAMTTTPSGVGEGVGVLTGADVIIGAVVAKGAHVA